MRSSSWLIPPVPRRSLRDRALVYALRLHPAVGAIGTAIGLAACWALVWATGGSQRAFSHVFYVPIVFAAVRFGLRGTLVTSILAATLAGPLMPLDSTTGEAQGPVAWFTRAVMFLAIGGLVTSPSRPGAGPPSSSSPTTCARRSRRRRPGRWTPTLAPLVADVLESKTFHTVFQPIYELSSGRLLGVEALTRVDIAPYRPPDEWFAAARQVGLGIELEIAAIRSAIAASAALPEGVDLAVNVAPSTLADPRLAELLERVDRPVTMEITEHAGIEDYDTLAGRIEALRLAGIRIAVDDAGAGVASLRHIVQLAPHVIKLDISLTQGVATSPLRRALAGSLIEFAQQTGAQLLVEGIEDAEDLAIWTALGAHAGPGVSHRPAVRAAGTAGLRRDHPRNGGRAARRP